MAPPKVPMGSLKKHAESARAKKATEGKLSQAREPVKSFKSKETVDNTSTDSSTDTSSGSESDSDSDIEAARKKLEATKAAQKAASAVNGKTNGAKRIAVSSKTQPATKVTKSMSKADSDSDSSSITSSDSDSDSDDKSKPTIAAKKEVKKAETGQSSSDSSDDSDDEEEERAEVKINATSDDDKSKKKENANKTLTNDSSESESESDDSSNHDNEVDPMAVARFNGRSATKKSDAEKSEVKKAIAESKNEASDVSRPEWLENSNFMLRKASSDNPGKEVTEFLSKSNLEGKQVWYFTAPASLPITVLKDMEIDLAKATAGGALLNLQSGSYGLDLEPFATNTQIQLLIPSKGTNEYKTLNHRIDSTVHLRRVAEFGAGSSVSSTATDHYIRQPKPIKEQPVGLKARYTPIGVPTQKIVKDAVAAVNASQKKTAVSGSALSDSDSDEEMADAPINSQPKSTNGSLKRKQPPADDDDSSSETSSGSDSSNSEKEAVPASQSKASKSSEKSAKRAKTSFTVDLTKTKFVSPAVATSSQGLRKNLNTEAKRGTPILPPSSIVSSSDVANETPSKKPSSAKQKTLAEKPKTVTPVPLPTFPMRK